jgi:cytochrome c-type biogenesis protein CcmH
VISSDPDPPRLGSNTLQVRLAAADGKPLSSARVEMKYGREEMGTLTLVPVQAAGEGVYRSDVEFDVPGAWQVILTLRQEGASDLSTKYVYNVAPSSTGGKAVVGTVRIAPALARKIAPGDVLFVIARKGPGPPLAAKRITDPSFPFSFRLGPEDMVMGGNKFEGEVSVIARIKKGGAAGPAQRGDLEGAYPGNPVKIGGTLIDIVIDREL